MPGPMMVLLTVKTIRDCFNFRYLLIMFLFLAFVWLTICLLFSIRTWFAGDVKPVFWGLDRIWKQEMEEHIKWIKETANPSLKLKLRSTEWYRQSHFTNHVGFLISFQSILTLIVLPFPILIITSGYLNRLFLHDELTLYCVRPLDKWQLFWGRFAGLFFVFSALICIGEVVMICGGIGPEWSEVVPLLVVSLQTKLAVLCAMLAIPLLVAPFGASLFRGAGTFVLSFTIYILAFALPGKSTLYSGLFPFRVGAKASLLAKILAIFQNVFILPVPRIFSAREGFDLCLTSFNDNLHTLEIGSVVLNQSGYWLWTVLNGLLVLSVAMVLWVRKEVK